MEKRVLSGMRPTGRLHLGHLVGVLSNWKRLQDEAECLYMVADWHALTSDYENPSNLLENIHEMVLDWLSVGIDTERCILFRQSEVKEHAELHLLLSNITPLGWLERNPTYKEQLAELGESRLSTYGFLGYPVLQSADILVYKANLVPIGKDQQPHLDLTRDIAARFNYFYGEVFPMPEPLLTPTSKLPGIDGRKMSKSYDNCVYLCDPPDKIATKVKAMFTDPLKIRKDDPGHPEGCVVFAFHKAFDSEGADVMEPLCREGKIGCVAHKETVAQILIKVMEPIRRRRSEFEGSIEVVHSIFEEGSKRAQEVASQTMEEVRGAMKI
ncbi:TPA: tryptophan--tRNA ligase [bacterium]|nr:tryptophan--tRNA ligase [bacterium]